MKHLPTGPYVAKYSGPHGAFGLACGTTQYALTLDTKGLGHQINRCDLHEVGVSSDIKHQWFPGTSHILRVFAFLTFCLCIGFADWSDSFGEDVNVQCGPPRKSFCSQALLTH